MYFGRKVKRFILSNIRKEIHEAVKKLSTQVEVEFPKEQERWLSQYVYREFKIHIDSKGDVKGGLLHMVFSLIDFNFVRSLIADCYSNEGGGCHDPVTLLLLEVIKIWARYQYYTDFLKDLNDKEKGAQYRYYTGVNIDNVPTEATLCNFRSRIGEERLQAIITFLVQLFNIIGIISGKVLSTDGTLLEAFARYRGCNYMEDCCKCLKCPESMIDDINSGIVDAIDEMDKKEKHSVIAAVKMQCPREEIIKKLIKMVKKKDPEALNEDIAAFYLVKLRIIKGEVPDFKMHKDYIESIFADGVKIPHEYSVEGMSCAVYRNDDNELKFECPRACKDITARTGYRRNKENPNKIEKVFGYKAVIMTSIEARFNLEIPIAVMTGPGNISEAETFIKLHKKLKAHVCFKTEYQILDSGYDYEYVYSYIRDGNGKPIIDYNKRREKLDKESLRKRGHDHNGYSYAPCGRVCKPNGFDSSRKALKNTCCKQCIKNGNNNELDECPYRQNKCGYTKWMTIKDLPRLILEVPRGTKKFKRIKAIRSSSERMNSFGKEWTGMTNLRIWGLNSYAVRVALCCIVMMLKKVMEFILRATVEHKNPALSDKLYNRKTKRKLKNCA